MQYGPWTYPAQSKRSVHIVFIFFNLLPEPHSLIILSRVDILMDGGEDILTAPYIPSPLAILPLHGSYPGI